MADAATSGSATSSTTAAGGTTSGRMADTGNWIRGCFLVSVGTDFNSYKAILEYTQADDTDGTKTKPTVDPLIQQILNTGKTPEDPLPVYFSKRKCRDSSVGGNDSINPLPQYSIDDDIAHPMFTTKSVDDKTEVTMGQVYSEHHDDLQQILYLGFGIPLFANVGNFWATATDMDMAGFVNKGSGITAEKIGYLLASAPVRIIKIATIPYKWIMAMANGLSEVPISKYYSFSSQMPMYFRFVNTILVMLATNMNMMGSNEDAPTSNANATGATATTLISDRTSGSSTTADLQGAPKIFRSFGIDMAKIMSKRFFYEQGKTSVSETWTDKAMFDLAKLNDGKGVVEDTPPPNESTNKDANATNSQETASASTIPKARNWAKQWVNSWYNAYTGTLYDGHLFIGFRIDKGMGASESFSNTTGESKIAQFANDKFAAGQEAAFQSSVSGGDGLVDMVSSAAKAAMGVISGAAKAFKLDPLGAAMTGTAKIDIPEVWMNSSWSRSASFSITCLAPYGDLETIFQSEYIPLACILAGSLPRGTGASSHSSPFVCQAYCRGVFSSPLCMIESLEVTRGADQFGMNAARLPLKLTMHVTLKDLTPVMYMTMGGDQGITNAIMGSDDNFGEYMMTLAGMGLRDRLSPFKSIRRKTSILMGTIYKNKLNPYMLGMEFGALNKVSRVISLFKSGGRGLPGN